MPINVVENNFCSVDNGNKIHTSIFVQKAYLRTNYTESNIEEDIDVQNQYKNKNLHFPQEKSDAVSKINVENLFNDASIIKNEKDIDFNDKKLRDYKICISYFCSSC